jgi:hypothetical protein
MQLSENPGEDDEYFEIAAGWRAGATGKAKKNARRDATATKTREERAVVMRRARQLELLRLRWVGVPRAALLAADEVMNSSIPQAVLARLRHAMFARLTVNIRENAPEGCELTPEFRRFFEEWWVRNFLPQFLDAYFAFGAVPVTLGRTASCRPVPHVAYGLGTALALEVRLNDVFAREFRVARAGSAAPGAGLFGGATGSLPRMWIAHGTNADPTEGGMLRSVGARLAVWHVHFRTIMDTGTIMEHARRVPKLLLQNQGDRKLNEVLGEFMPDVNEDFQRGERALAMDRGAEDAHRGVQRSLGRAMAAEVRVSGREGWPAPMVVPSGLHLESELRAQEGTMKQYESVARQYWRIVERSLGMSSEYEPGPGMQKVRDSDPYSGRAFDETLDFLMRLLSVVLTELFRVGFDSPDAIVELRVQRTPEQVAALAQMQADAATARATASAAAGEPAQKRPRAEAGGRD